MTGRKDGHQTPATRDQEAQGRARGETSWSGWLFGSSRSAGRPSSCIVRYREWYGRDKDYNGLRLTAEEVARGIVKRETKEDHESKLVHEAITYGVLTPCPAWVACSGAMDLTRGRPPMVPTLANPRAAATSLAVAISPPRSLRKPSKSTTSSTRIF